VILAQQDLERDHNNGCREPVAPFEVEWLQPVNNQPLHWPRLNMQFCSCNDSLNRMSAVVQMIFHTVVGSRLCSPINSSWLLSWSSTYQTKKNTNYSVLETSVVSSTIIENSLCVSFLRIVVAMISFCIAGLGNRSWDFCSHALRLGTYPCAVIVAA